MAERTSPISGEDLERESMALLNTHFALRRHFDVHCIEHGITPRIGLESNSVNMIMQAVALGRHVTVLPNSIAMAQPGLTPVMLLPELPHHTITLFCHKGSYKSPACLAFGNIAAEWAASRSHVARAEQSCVLGSSRPAPPRKVAADKT